MKYSPTSDWAGLAEHGRVERPEPGLRHAHGDQRMERVLTALRVQAQVELVERPRLDTRDLKSAPVDETERVVELDLVGPIGCWVEAPPAKMMNAPAASRTAIAVRPRFMARRNLCGISGEAALWNQTAPRSWSRAAVALTSGEQSALPLLPGPTRGPVVAAFRNAGAGSAGRSGASRAGPRARRGWRAVRVDLTGVGEPLNHPVSRRRRAGRRRARGRVLERGHDSGNAPGGIWPWR